jgi:hypothetical protein
MYTIKSLDLKVIRLLVQSHKYYNRIERQPGTNTLCYITSLERQIRKCSLGKACLSASNWHFKRKTDRIIDRLIHKLKEKQTKMQTDGDTDRMTYRQIEIQTD